MKRTQDRRKTKTSFWPVVCPRDRLPQPILAEHPGWCDLYWKAWNIGWSNIEHPARPGWKPQMSCMPDSGNIWQWDSCFMAMFCRYSAGAFPGLNNLDNLYRMQARDGYISMAYKIATETPAYGKLINPPLYAWVEWETFRTMGDRRRLARVLPVIVKLFDWIKAHRRRANGIYWFEIPGATGMDNSPRGGSIRDGGGLGHIDLSAQQALSARHIAAMACSLGQSKLAARFETEYRELKELINATMWSDKTGFYHDIFDDTYVPKNFVNHKTVAGFWPLLAGIATLRQSRRLVEHLLHPAEFWRAHPVPTLSADDPNYDSLGGYWRGGVWAPTNYMVAKGLEQYGYWDTARELAMRHIEQMRLVDRTCTPSSLWECYSPDHVRPGTAKQGELSRNQLVGWSGLGPIAMLIEHVLGLELDAPGHALTWHIGLCEEHGIRNLPFGNGRVDLLCRARGSLNARPEVTVTAPVPLTLKIQYLHTQREFSVRPGRERTLRW